MVQDKVYLNECFTDTWKKSVFCSCQVQWYKYVDYISFCYVFQVFYIMLGDFGFYLHGLLFTDNYPVLFITWSIFVGYCFKYNWILCLVYLVKATNAPCIFCPCREKDLPRRTILMLWCGARDSGPQDDKAFWSDILAVNSCPFAVHLVSATWKSDDTRWRKAVLSA